MIKQTSNIILSIATALTLAGCGGGSSSSTSESTDDNEQTSEVTFGEEQISTEIVSYYPDAEQNITVQLGFSPVSQRECDYLVTNTNDTNICIDTNANEDFESHPNIDLSDKNIGYFTAFISGITEEEFEERFVTIHSVVDKPKFTNSFSVDFGTYNNYDEYSATGEVCISSGDMVKATISSAQSEQTLDMTAKGDGCYTLPDITSLEAGTYQVTNLKIYQNGVEEISLSGELGSFSLDTYTNSQPEVTISKIEDTNAMYDDGDGVMNYSDKSGSLTFECSASDNDEDELEVSGSYGSSQEDTLTTELNTNNQFTTDLSDFGGKSLYAKCLVSDSFGESNESETLSYDILQSVDCEGSWEYGSWSSCSVSCGGGTQSRTNTYNITTSALYGGDTCSYSDGYTTTETQSCNTQSCSTGGDGGTGF